MIELLIERFQRMETNQGLKDQWSELSFLISVFKTPEQYGKLERATD